MKLEQELLFSAVPIFSDIMEIKLVSINLLFGLGVLLLISVPTWHHHSHHDKLKSKEFAQ